jgi:hypothetical protein
VRGKGVQRPHAEVQGMAKSRKPPQLCNFDGERLSMTRDVYQFPARRRKTLVAKLEGMARLESDDQESFAYKDERQRLLGFVSLKKGELWVDGNSVERAERISREVVAACGDLLTYSHRLEHAQLMAEVSEGDSGLDRGGNAFAYGGLDSPLGGTGMTLRELLENPDTRAQLQAQMPPGVDLSRMLNSFDDILDEEHDDDDEVTVQSFISIGLRLDLLDEPGGHWVFNVPEWLTLGNLHRVITALLGREPGDDFMFVFPDQNYDCRAKGDTHPDTLTLRRAFGFYDSAFYIWRNPEWGFSLRRSRLFTSARAAVELVRTEIYPPADCATPAEYKERLAAGSLPRAEPFESLERRLHPYAEPAGSTIGPYNTKGMTLASVLFAILLERQDRPTSVFELSHRAAITDFAGQVSVPAVRRALKREPFRCDSGGTVTLDSSSPSYARTLRALEKHRAPAGPRLVARRFTSQTAKVEGRQPDLVLVVDDGPGLVHGCVFCHRDEGSEPMVRAIREALVRFPEAVAVVVDDLYHLAELQEELDIWVEWRLAVVEPWEAFQALEQHQIDEHGGGGYCYPAGLSQAALAAFCAAAQRYYLLCPWVNVSDSDVFEIVGLTPKPLIASVLGQAHEVYGLALYEGYGNYLRMRHGDMDASNCFMDFLESTFTGRLREQLRQAGIPLLDNDTCPFAYGIRQPATPTQFRILTEVLDLVSRRINDRGQVSEGTTEEKDSLGRTIRVTYPVSPEQATQAPSSKARPGRNDPCWCGSGTKYKKCHYALDG